MGGFCGTCVFFQKIKGVIGYCAALGVMVEGDVATLDIAELLERARDSENQKIYANIVVQELFGCMLHEGKNVEIKQ